MTGVSLVAIRGTTDFEDTVLNLAGMLAPIVALVPATCPEGPEAAGITCPGGDPIVLSNLNVVTAVIAAAIALVLAFGLAAAAKKLRPPIRVQRDPGDGETRPGNVLRGLILAALVAGAMIVIHQNWPGQTHFAAAFGLIFGLWLVATGNAVRNASDPRSAYRERIAVAWAAGASGTGQVAGLTLIAVGAVRIQADATNGWSTVLAGLALVALATALGWGQLGHYWGVFGGRDRYAIGYLVISMVMLVLGLLLGLAPEFERQVFWLELAELAPFGAFWLIQTVEYWDKDPGRDDPIAFKGETAASEEETSGPATR